MTLPQKSDGPLRLNLRRSHYLALGALALHAGAVMVITPLILVWQVKTMLTLMIVSSLIYVLNTHVLLRSRHAVVQMEWQDEDWTLRTASGAEWRGQLLPSSYTHPNLIVLNFKLAKPAPRFRAIVILADSLDPTSYRRLRALLNFWTPRDK